MSHTDHSTPFALSRSQPLWQRMIAGWANRLHHGRLTLVFPDGREFHANGEAQGPSATLRLNSADPVWKLVSKGSLGFAEAYMDGHWESPDMAALLELAILNEDRLGDVVAPSAVLGWAARLRHRLRRNTRAGSRRNIAFHYDLGNAFYRLWLDETMTYSSAIFQNPQESLEAAQRRKYASMIDQMGAQAGDHVLEIGCGWGGFAEFAAQERGLRVTGLTISQAQHDFAVERVRRAGLADRVEIRLQDYRDERGSYDGIASIEMFEAVGERYWPVYFDAVRERLKPGRNATLQIITVADSRWQLYRRGVDFIQKHIFPGGMLPAPSVLRAEVVKAGLRIKGTIEFGESYSLTLRRWHETFTARWAEVKSLGFDERFKRMWDFYLASCAGAFQGGNCDVTQITVTRPS